MKKYSNEFKKEAVCRYTESGKKLSMIASEMGISPSTLFGWVNKNNDSIITKNSPETNCTVKEDRVNTLEKKITDLQEQNVALLKAIVYITNSLRIVLE